MEYNFIERAIYVHGNKYNYSKVEYRGQNEKVCIICPEHGEFWQTPKSHIVRKYGCPKCGRVVCGDKLKNDKNSFIGKANKVHEKKYDYSKVEYKNAYEKICIICPEHGEFFQSPHDHLKGAGCPECGRKRTIQGRKYDKEKFIEKARILHCDKYDYSLVKEINNNEKIPIICPEHGEFWQTPYAHLQGQGCPDCGYKKIGILNSYIKEDFINRCHNIYGNFYQYNRVNLVNRKNNKICIVCPKHGEFWQNPYLHLNGVGCPECGREKTIKARKLTQEEFERRANAIHNNFYDYSNTHYVGYREKVEINCPIHGVFLQTPDDHLQGKGCPKCGNQISKAENEIYEFCCSLVGKENVVQRCRSVIKPQELDIYIPSMKIAIEYNGLRWHCDRYKTDKRYHYNKLIACKEKGVRLIQVFEDEYINRKDIVLSKISHLLKKCEKLPQIMGRKCEIREISVKECRDFLEKNHIQGYGSGGVHLGAFYNDILIGTMVFRNEKPGFWELTRFATDNNYICAGVGGKLLKHFTKTHDFIEIKSFADRRWTINEENNIYTRLGFEFDSYTPIDYHYFKEEDGMERQHKFAFRKERLHRKYGLPLTMTEREMTEKLGYSKVYDCGLIKYVLRH